MEKLNKTLVPLQSHNHSSYRPGSATWETHRGVDLLGACRWLTTRDHHSSLHYSQRSWPRSTSEDSQRRTQTHDCPRRLDIYRPCVESETWSVWLKLDPGKNWIRVETVSDMKLDSSWLKLDPSWLKLDLSRWKLDPRVDWNWIRVETGSELKLDPS